ncbi:MTH1187 family thiamine-binding protein [Shimazuella sp. AN120528]|uniref:MTH1187 family thiamine-binding protein n=1 Tax=Shimazuella soli TaxID=1892854 RepID=UPI001F0CECD3|nr:MTH1187 family thiamine-binding protein [Shimazuella soli]MCH5584976.1 MTH1187 family thiamine-binding protein [Shimazuella soli]
MALMEISLIPVGTQSPSFSSSVVNAVRLIEEKGLKYQITPTATIIEGDINQLMDTAKAIHQNAITNGAHRIVTNISIDERMDKPISMEQQVEIIEQSLQ